MKDQIKLVPTEHPLEKKRVKLVDKPNEDIIFVFGSNLAGRHGAGAAKVAYNSFGAKYGRGVGRTGMAYAIPTKDIKLVSLPLSSIEFYVKEFLQYAGMNKHLTFMVTRVGCGLARYTDEQIAPMFKNAPSNCILSKEWKKVLCLE